MYTKFSGWELLLQLATVPVLIMILQTPEPSAARFTRLPARGTLRSKTLGFELMQYHHVSSPVALPNLSLAQRVDIAVKSSRERTYFFKSQISRNLRKTEAGFGTEDVFSSPVYYGQGSYIMQLQLGTPARTFVVISDTGSDLVWVQCANCTTCNAQPDPYFNPLASLTYKFLPCSNNTLCSALPFSSCSPTSTCQYQYYYGSLAATGGDLALDTVTLSNNATGVPTTFPNFTFGCGQTTQGSFDGMDGVAGLGQGPLSLVVQLGSQFGNFFSYCLVDFFSATNKTSLLLFGDAGDVNFTFTPLLSNPVNPSFYYVNLLGITVNGQNLSYPQDAFSIDSWGNGGFILDSGTTITILPTNVSSAMVSQMSSLIQYPTVESSIPGLDLCYNLQNVSTPVWPTVVFNFDQVDLALPGPNVFLEVDNASTYCLIFQGSDYAEVSIFGNVQQQNFRIAYDLANARVGFAATTC